MLGEGLHFKLLLIIKSVSVLSYQVNLVGRDGKGNERKSVLIRGR